MHAFYAAFREISQRIEERFAVDCELLLVNDGSADASLAIMRELAQNDPRVHYLSFSRNFGKEAALYAGLKNADGDYVAVMDADLQHPPAMLEDMMAGLIIEGYDCVSARRVSRKGEGFVRSFFSRSFYRLINSMSDTKLVDGATDFTMMKRQVVQAILSLQEVNRFTKGINSWVGFETKWIPYENVARSAGKTTWSFRSLFLYSMQGILSFTTAPLAVTTLTGILLCLFAIIFMVVVLVRAVNYGEPVAGFPALICAICFIGGVQLLCLGIASQYLAKLYLEVKNRPLYIVKETSKL